MSDNNDIRTSECKFVILVKLLNGDVHQMLISDTDIKHMLNTCSKSEIIKADKTKIEGITF